MRYLTEVIDGLPWVNLFVPLGKLISSVLDWNTSLLVLLVQWSSKYTCIDQIGTNTVVLGSELRVNHDQ